MLRQQSGGFSLCLCFKNGTMFCEIIEQKKYNSIVSFPSSALKSLIPFKCMRQRFKKKTNEYKDFCY